MKNQISLTGSLRKQSLALAVSALCVQGVSVNAQQVISVPAGAATSSLAGNAFLGTTNQVAVPSYAPVSVATGALPAGFQTAGGAQFLTPGVNAVGAASTVGTTSAYTGPVFSLPGVNAGQQLPAEVLNGPVVNSINTPLGAPVPLNQTTTVTSTSLPTVTSTVVAPEPAPTLPLPSVDNIIVEPKVFSGGMNAPYLAVKAMRQDPKTFMWNGLTTGNLGEGYLVTDGKKGRTLLAAVGVPISKNLRVKGLVTELEAGFRDSDVTSMVGNLGTASDVKGQIQITSGAVNLIKEFKNPGRWGAYAGAGVGLAEIKHKNLSATYNGTSVGITQDDDLTVMSNLFGGLSYALSPRTKLVGELRQVNFADIDRNANNGASLEDSYILHEGGLGIKFGF